MASQNRGKGCPCYDLITHHTPYRKQYSVELPEVFNNFSVVTRQEFNLDNVYPLFFFFFKVAMRWVSNRGEKKAS